MVSIEHIREKLDAKFGRTSTERSRRMLAATEALELGYGACRWLAVSVAYRALPLPEGD